MVMLAFAPVRHLAFTSQKQINLSMRFAKQVTYKHNKHISGDANLREKICTHSIKEKSTQLRADTFIQLMV